ncbi:hypothetical protein CL656_05090 [bacterium]|nr:hypothetical protein [bacterium]
MINTNIFNIELGNGGIFSTIKYCGLILKEEVAASYSKIDCLMIQLSDYHSLSLVIPSKVFMYASTPYPIIYSAEGFTKRFLEKISGSIYFDKNNPSSFFDSILKSRSTQINIENRDSFLDLYNSDVIYSNYASHILK